MSLERIARNFRSSREDEPKSAESTESNDCLPCRLVGGLGCIGITCYVAAQARGTKRFTYATYMFISASFAAVGSLRLAGLDYLRKTTSFFSKAFEKIDKSEDN
ncbi:Hypothetical protein NTJ_05855 [Nesidiocoris tenuis]|uniref:Distal membrane-arm assembly complex protein 1-like domain-containing protein n=1 Tax=Nesidiocoris tenuis TaxID=355587 RepID=A0ABN7AQ68_9HEMI|nr:Hypothetical protein NTJ_05855 [Nesidiocoris tenuis]